MLDRRLGLYSVSCGSLAISSTTKPVLSPCLSQLLQAVLISRPTSDPDPTLLRQAQHLAQPFDRVCSHPVLPTRSGVLRGVYVLGPKEPSSCSGPSLSMLAYQAEKLEVEQSCKYHKQSSVIWINTSLSNPH